MTTTRAYASFQPTWQRFNDCPPPGAASGEDDKENAQSKKSGKSGKSKQQEQVAPQQNQQHPYARQYSHVYSARLAQLRDRCLASAAAADEVGKRSGGNDDEAPVVVPRIIEVKEGTPCTVVGTIAVEGGEATSVDASSSSTYLAPSAASFLFGGDDKKKAFAPLRAPGGGESTPTLFLEDESGRVELSSPSGESGDDDDVVNALLDVATGVVAAITGVVDPDTGIMSVRSVHFPTPPPPSGTDAEDDDESIPLQRGPSDDPDSAPCLLLVSGLGCGGDGAADGDDGDLSLRRDLLLEYVTDASDVCRIVVAGGGCARPAASEPSSATSSSSATASALLPIRALDQYLAELCATGTPVDCAPGWHDPTNANWPQRSIHPCLLPHAESFVDLFHRSPNPYEAIVGGRTVLGTDGLNVADLSRSSRRTGEGCATSGGALDALRNTLRYGHLCPTGPSAVPTFPSPSSMDPFVMDDDAPDLYFAGNCPAFETDVFAVSDDNKVEGTTRETRLVCVPSFVETGEAVLVNLRTLECEVIRFDGAVVEDDGDAAMQQ